jgi:hypothetical protein
VRSTLGAKPTCSSIRLLELRGRRVSASPFVLSIIDDLFIPSDDPPPARRSRGLGGRRSRLCAGSVSRGRTCSACSIRLRIGHRRAPAREARGPRWASISTSRAAVAQLWKINAAINGPYQRRASRRRSFAPVRADLRSIVSQPPLPVPAFPWYRRVGSPLTAGRGDLFALPLPEDHAPHLIALAAAR